MMAIDLSLNEDMTAQLEGGRSPDPAAQD